MDSPLFSELNAHSLVSQPDAPIRLGYSRRRFLINASVAAFVTSNMGAFAGSRPKHVAWLNEIQTQPEGLKVESPLPGIVDAEGQPIRTLDAWKTRRKEIRNWWLDFLGPLPGPNDWTPRLKVLEEDRIGGVIRQRVSYEIEPGLHTQGYLLKPKITVGKRPGVAVFHSTVNHSIRQPAGVEGKPEKAFGLKLAQQGCVTLCPRNYLWPDNHHIAAQAEAKRFHQRHPRSKGMAKMLYDAIVAVNILAAHPDVDASRLGSVGHSLGAKEVLYLAAFDDRVKITVSSEGGIGTTFSNWDASWYLSGAIQQQNFTREHHELLALTAPRPFLLIGGDSADGDRSWPFIEAAKPIYQLYKGKPRLGLYNHKQGHSVPPKAEQRIYEWLATYL